MPKHLRTTLATAAATALAAGLLTAATGAAWAADRAAPAANGRQGDFNGDKKADLTVAAVYEDGGNGALTTLPSDGTRLTTTGSRFLSPPQSAFPPRAPRSWAASWRGEGEACAFHGVELRFLGAALPGGVCGSVLRAP
ncbi:hypothetical protein [Streptomyces nigrescens]